jgi:hypothetical protein
MNEAFRERIFETLSERFGKQCVLLEYPFEKTVDGFVFSKEFNGMDIKTSSNLVKECLNGIESKMQKYIGLILPVTLNDIEEQVDDTRDAILEIALDLVDTIKDELNIKHIPDQSGGLIFEDIITRLKLSMKTRKQKGTIAKSIEALILYGYSFEDLK